MGYRLFDFKCPQCGVVREELVWNDEVPVCLECEVTMKRVPNTFGLIIPNYLGRTKVERGSDVDMTKGSKEWNNS